MKSHKIKKQPSVALPMLLKAVGHPGPVATAQESLDYMRVHYERGAVAALYDALYVVEELGLRAPGWVLKGALRVVGDRLKTGESIGDGSAGNERIYYQRQILHFRRWLAYQVVIAEGTPIIDAY